MATKLFIVGKNTGGNSWEFQGVFDSRAMAEDACVEESYFVGPAYLNVALPSESTQWEHTYYPHANGK